MGRPMRGHQGWPESTFALSPSEMSLVKLTHVPPKRRRRDRYPGYLIGLALAMLHWGCRCADCEDDGPEASVPPPGRLWREAAVETERPIIDVYTSPSEVFVFTESEFVRAAQHVDESQLRVVDKRRFRSALRREGQPAVNDLVFARGALDTETGEQLVEFQTVQNAGGVRQLIVDSVRIDSTFDELIALYTAGREIGAFTRDGRVYAQPIVRRQSRTLALMLIGLDYDEPFERFASVEPFAVVDLPGVREEDRALSSITLLDGSFYVATKFGGFRVSRTGQVEQVVETNTGVRDFFRFEGTFYATREGTGSMLVSEDGFLFGTSDFVQDFGVVEVLGEFVVAQRFEGWPFFVTEDLSRSPDSLALNPDFTRSLDAFYGLDRLNGRYYLGLGGQVYVADSLATTPAP